MLTLLARHCNAFGASKLRDALMVGGVALTATWAVVPDAPGSMKKDGSCSTSADVGVAASPVEGSASAGAKEDGAAAAAAGEDGGGGGAG